MQYKLTFTHWQHHIPVSKERKQSTPPGWTFERVRAMPKKRQPQAGDRHTLKASAFRLPPILKHQVRLRAADESYALDHNVSMNDIIRQAVELYLSTPLKK